MTRCATFAGRPSPLLEARRFAEAAGCRVFLKREDLLHTGAHKINNTIGQCLLTRRMGKPRVIAETGAGQHGVATAAAARRVRPRVRRLHGRRGHAPPAPERRAHEAARRRGARRRRRQRARSRTRSTRRCATGSTRVQRHALRARLGARPASVPDDGARLPPRDRDRGARAVRRARSAACPTCSSRAWGGSNAIGLFHAFLGDPQVRKVGVEAGGHGLASAASTRRVSPSTASACSTARARSCLQDARGMIRETHSVSAGLDYPALGPEHAWLADQGLAEYSVADRPTRRSPRSRRCRGSRASCPRSRRARARVGAARGEEPAARYARVVNLSGRGDKDVNEVLRVLEAERLRLGSRTRHFAASA